MINVKKYRKLPVEIEAIQWTGNSYKSEIEKFVGKELQLELESETAYLAGKGAPLFSLLIETKEGVMKAMPGDWIIKEAFPTGDRDFYPCKPDIFAKTYEAVEKEGAKEHYLSEKSVPGEDPEAGKFSESKWTDAEKEVVLRRNGWVSNFDGNFWRNALRFPKDYTLDEAFESQLSQNQTLRDLIADVSHDIKSKSGYPISPEEAYQESPKLMGNNEMISESYWMLVEMKNQIDKLAGPYILKED